MSSDTPLDRNALDPNPVQQFDSWFKEYQKLNPPEPTATALATATPEGLPSVRFVLLKEYSDRGFVFYTNYSSSKGIDLVSNPVAELAFYWNPLNRQVRVRGEVGKLSSKESDHYFASRPVESQLSAWASHQSEPLPDRETLDQRMEDLRQRFKGQAVPRPPHWGGFLLQPQRIEFWQGRTGRMHDRFVYLRNDKTWTIQRLNP